jgi:hypothetical protein
LGFYGVKLEGWIRLSWVSDQLRPREDILGVGGFGLFSSDVDILSLVPSFPPSGEKFMGVFLGGLGSRNWSVLLG